MLALVLALTLVLVLVVVLVLALVLVLGNWPEAGQLQNLEVEVNSRNKRSFRSAGGVVRG